MFLLTGLTDFWLTSTSENYDKLRLLSNSYSFLWETGSHPTVTNLGNKATNIDSTFTYDIKQKNRAKYNSFLIMLLNVTKHKISKTLNLIQHQNKMTSKTNHSSIKEKDFSSNHIHNEQMDNVKHVYKQRRYRKNFNESTKSSKFNLVGDKNNFQSLHSSTSSNAACIVQRKYVKYSKWRDKSKQKYIVHRGNKEYQTPSSSMGDIFNLISHMNEYRSKYSLQKTTIHEESSHVHKQFLFGQIVDEDQWESFQFLITTGIDVNSIQKKIKTFSMHTVSTVEIYPSVMDLFLRNVPLQHSYSSLSSRILLNCEQKTTNTPWIFPKILASLLQRGADIRIADNFDLQTLTGGIQSDTISHVCQNAAIQLDNIFHFFNLQINVEIVDSAGILRQLLTAGMIPPKLFFLEYTDKLLLDNVKLNHHFTFHEISSIVQVTKNIFYPLLIYEFVKWSFYAKCSSHCLPTILQSFTVLFFNLVYSGLCLVPNSVVDILDINSFTQCNYDDTESLNILEPDRFLCNFCYFHDKFLQLVNRRPFSLLIQCRYVVRCQLGTQYFHEKLTNTNFVDHTNESSVLMDTSTKKFHEQLLRLPDQLKRDIGYIEAKNLKDELCFLTEI
ncbi:unnamed protein product [Heterobilharzia americana]|nr:unnamed protein product [Heterobilharzia americana]